VDSGGMPKVDLNGIRIKSDSSRGGVVDRVVYRDVCIRDMVNPILISPVYSRATGAMIPDYRNITMENIRAFKTPGSAVAPQIVTLRGNDADHVMTLTLDNVVVEDPAPVTLKAEYVNLNIGPGGSNLRPTGNGVRINDGSKGPVAPNPCAGKFGPPPPH
jgi:polygalacturonase